MQFSVPQYKKDIKLLESVQKGHKDSEESDLLHVGRTCGHLVCSTWRRLRGRPYYGLVRASGEAGTDFFTLVTSDRF